MLGNLLTGVRKLAADRRGNMTMLFGFGAVVVLGSGGMALDLGRAFYVQTKLQAASDRAAMAASLARNMTDSQRLQVALDSFAANVSSSALTAGAVPTVSVGGATNAAAGPGNTPPVIGTITVKAALSMPTVLLALLNQNLVNISVKSTVQATGKILDLGMMIDITGSMADVRNGTTKIDALKAAAVDLLDIVLPDNQPAGLSRVGIAPFAQYVNAGPYAAAVTGLAPNGTYTANQGPPVTTATGPLVTCVTERTGSDAYTDAAPSGSADIGAPNQGQGGVENYSADGTCNVAGRELPQVIPLTSDKASLLAAIHSFTTGGPTPGHLGTAWAWYLISPNWSGIWPGASTPKPYDEKTLKVVVLMTDGEYNTQYSGVDSKTQALGLCSAMKAQGVVVFTIGFGLVSGNSSDDSARNTLQTCATDANHFFFPYDGTELRAVFQNIGSQIAAAQGGTRLAN